MKMLASFRSFVALPLLFLLSLAAPIQAQTYKTNDMALPFTTITAAANSNITAFGNSGGYAAATAYQILTEDPIANPYTVSVNFSCPTVTLASASFVFAWSVDGTSWENIPARATVLNAPASASSGNNTNVTVSFNSADTNFLTSARQPPRLPFMTLAGATNANAATLTINWVRVRERRPQ